MVKTLEGKIYEGDYLIVALPPCNVKKIKFLPELPIERKNFFSKNMMGHLDKAIFLYKEPYWRQKGFSG